LTILKYSTNALRKEGKEMKKAFCVLVMVILLLSIGCATTKEAKDFSNLKDWPDDELMSWYDRLDPSSGMAVGSWGHTAYAAGKQDERRAIRQELEARGYVYHPEKKQAALGYSGYHPEWGKK
jgi:hypothetical protein